MNGKGRSTGASEIDYSTQIYPSQSMDELLDDTLKFFLKPIATELSQEIDLRARGYGKNLIRRIGIYTVAFLRDLTRIPLHYYKGIGQAQFRFRVAYISNTAIPTLNFFLTRYPLEEKQCRLIEEAIDFLQKGEGLIRNGSIPSLDEWYATMEEFYQLTTYSQEAAKKIEEVMNFKR